MHSHCVHSDCAKTSTHENRILQLLHPVPSQQHHHFHPSSIFRGYQCWTMVNTPRKSGRTRFLFVSSVSHNNLPSSLRFQKYTLFKMCWFFTNNLLEPINEEIYFLIIDWFLIVDLLYLIPPIYIMIYLFIFDNPNLKKKKTHFKYLSISSWKIATGLKHIPSGFISFQKLQILKIHDELKLYQLKSSMSHYLKPIISMTHHCKKKTCSTACSYMQKVPGSFCSYTNHSPKVIQPSFDAHSLCRLLDDSLAGACCMSTAGSSPPQTYLILPEILILELFLGDTSTLEKFNIGFKSSFPGIIHGIEDNESPNLLFFFYSCITEITTGSIEINNIGLDLPYKKFFSFEPASQIKPMFHHFLDSASQIFNFLPVHFSFPFVSIGIFIIPWMINPQISFFNLNVPLECRLSKYVNRQKEEILKKREADIFMKTTPRTWKNDLHDFEDVEFWCLISNCHQIHGIHQGCFHGTCMQVFSLNLVIYSADTCCVELGPKFSSYPLQFNNKSFFNWFQLVLMSSKWRNKFDYVKHVVMVTRHQLQAEGFCLSWADLKTGFGEIGVRIQSCTRCVVSFFHSKVFSSLWLHMCVSPQISLRIRLLFSLHCHHFNFSYACLRSHRLPDKEPVSVWWIVSLFCLFLIIISNHPSLIQSFQSFRYFLVLCSSLPLCFYAQIFFTEIKL
ncbi:hypothetical protein VP01_1853g2 [Puccinia sorghi]|uniref:Uncharacterized protein n=1 Tax=Puccinia sorghi TaxID=27349 RepID=A0A0L6VE32_9BASI|nr:hypothetical protein VP01_1853g2 [Puccinia sorghi]